ncbi:hypothetical protein BH11PSE3_BH11PSE3_28140 [soil metagenome]
MRPKKSPDRSVPTRKLPPGMAADTRGNKLVPAKPRRGGDRTAPPSSKENAAGRKAHPKG